jgi:hypothetical protein
LKKSKEAQAQKPENPTIFHAFFEALKDMEEEKDSSTPLLRRLKLCK